MTSFTAYNLSLIWGANGGIACTVVFTLRLRSSSVHLPQWWLMVISKQKQLILL